jgi:hypothetical protein
MDVGFRTPLLDAFRRREVARDLKLLAARGAIAPRPLEQLGLLVLLTSDEDASVRDTAEQTIAKIPAELISGFIARAEVPTELREFFVKRGLSLGSSPGAEPTGPLVDEDATDYGPEPRTEAEKLSVVQQLANMTVPEKVMAAMKGGREMRSVLVRDSNKLVALAVLSSPRLTETEVESIARMGSVSEDVLRTIASTRAWMKNYGVVVALVQNAKTPLAISMNLMGRLIEKDLKLLSINRNVPETLRITARKKLVLG